MNGEKEKEILWKAYRDIKSEPKNKEVFQKSTLSLDCVIKIIIRILTILFEVILQF